MKKKLLTLCTTLLFSISAFSLTSVKSLIPGFANSSGVSGTNGTNGTNTSLDCSKMEMMVDGVLQTATMAPNGKCKFNITTGAGGQGNGSGGPVAPGTWTSLFSISCNKYHNWNVMFNRPMNCPAGQGTRITSSRCSGDSCTCSIPVTYQGVSHTYKCGGTQIGTNQNAGYGYTCVVCRKTPVSI